MRTNKSRGWTYYGTHTRAHTNYAVVHGVGENLTPCMCKRQPTRRHLRVPKHVVVVVVMVGGIVGLSVCIWNANVWNSLVCVCVCAYKNPESFGLVVIVVILFHFVYIDICIFSYISLSCGRYSCLPVCMEWGEIRGGFPETIERLEGHTTIDWPHSSGYYIVVVGVVPFSSMHIIIIILDPSPNQSPLPIHTHTHTLNMWKEETHQQTKTKTKPRQTRTQLPEETKEPPPEKVNFLSTKSTHPTHLHSNKSQNKQKRIQSNQDTRTHTHGQKKNGCFL